MPFAQPVNRSIGRLHNAYANHGDVTAVPMSRLRARSRSIVVACGCSVLLAATALGVRWWDKSRHQQGPLAQGQAAYLQGDWIAAERIAREQVKKNPGDPGALRLLSRALFRQSRDQPAVAITNRISPVTITAEDYFLLGQSRVRSQQVDVAIDLWKKAIETEPDHVESRVALEQAFFRLDRLAEAAEQADSLLAVPRRAALAELMHGQICASNPTRPAPVWPLSVPWASRKHGSRWSTKTRYASNSLASCFSRSRPPGPASSCSL